MKNIKFLMALAVLFVLVLPAFSMPDKGIGQDCGQKDCDCWKSSGFGDKHPWQGQDAWKKCDCEKPCCSMGQCNCHESMMGHYGDHKEFSDTHKSMMEHKEEQRMWQDRDDEHKEFGGCQKSMMGMDDMHKGFDGCQKSMMGMDDMHKGFDGCQKSMMEDGRHMNRKHIKSMMGDRDVDIKFVIINLKV
jgi:hypothetical protein